MGGSRDYDKERGRGGERDHHYRDRRHEGREHSRRRSTDRYSSEDNEDDQYERQYRSNRDYDHRRGHSSSHREERVYRDRSRSRERDRHPVRDHRRSDRGGYEEDFNNDYSANNDYYYNEGDNYYGGDNYGGEDDDGYENGRYYNSHREETPNSTIMVRNLAPEMTEADIVAKLAETGLTAKDIRLMRRKDTGASRGFAFVEFANLSEAVQWKDSTQGYLDFENCQATLHYSVPKEPFPGGPSQKYDWTCYKCSVNNFKRRDQCFKCGIGREESAANEPPIEISPLPTNSLLLRHLSAETTEERVISALGNLTGLPIKNIRIPRDPQEQSKEVCLVELHTTVEASQLFTLLSSLPAGFVVDKYQLSINYAKRPGSYTAPVNSMAVNAASVALAAAQWTNQTDSSATPGAVTGAVQLGTVAVNGVNYQKFPMPADPTTLQLDPTSGYYFDASTQLYFEPKSRYYYNAKTQQYLSWSPENSTYLPVESGSKKEASSQNGGSSTQDQEVKTNVQSKKANTSKDTKSDKVTTAKKIAKDMEKWAKTLNQRTARATQMIISSRNVFEDEDDEQNLPECPSASSSLAETKRISIAFGKGDRVKDSRSFSPSECTASISDDEIDVRALVKAEEAALVDWDKLLCRICKRQLNSKDVLEKHLKISEVHKKNLETHLQSKLTDDQMEWFLAKGADDNGSAYQSVAVRDRAKERRKKYGPADQIEPNSLKDKFMSTQASLVSSQSSYAAPPKKIGTDNIGSKMLKKMGWSEGEGLGRQKQGRRDIIDVKARASGSGLGTKAAVTEMMPGETYKDAVKRAMAQRYKELNGDVE